MYLDLSGRCIGTLKITANEIKYVVSIPG